MGRPIFFLAILLIVTLVNSKSVQKNLDFQNEERQKDPTFHRRQLDLFSTVAIAGGTLLLAIYNRPPQDFDEELTSFMFRHYHNEKKKAANITVPLLADIIKEHSGRGSGQGNTKTGSAATDSGHPYPGAGYSYIQDGYGNWGIGPSQPGGTPPTPPPGFSKPTPQSAIGSRIETEKPKLKKTNKPILTHVSWAYGTSGDNNLWYNNKQIPTSALESNTPEVITLDDSDEEVEVVGIVNPWETVVIQTPAVGRKRILSNDAFAQSTAPKQPRISAPPSNSIFDSPVPGPSRETEQVPITRKDSKSPKSQSTLSIKSSSDGLDEEGNPIERPTNPTQPPSRIDVRPFDGTPLLYEGGVRRSQFTIRGFNHYTPSVTNACTLDTFLSAVLFRAMRFYAGPEAFMQNYFRLSDSIAEDTLRAIIRNIVSNPFRHDDSSKLLWATNVMLRRHGRSRTINIVGNAVSNVFMHLDQSSIIFREYSCVCPDQSREHTSYEMFSRMPVQHMSVSKVPGKSLGTQRLNPLHNPLNSDANAPSPWSDKSFKCGKCKGDYRQSRISVPDTTWIVWQAIEYEHQVTDFATTIEFHQLDHQYGRVTFDLGYISLVSRRDIDHAGAMLTHNVGLMWIENNYYLYDDMSPTQVPVIVIDPNLLLTNWEIREIVYFRR